MKRLILSTAILCSLAPVSLAHGFDRSLIEEILRTGIASIEQCQFRRVNDTFVRNIYDTRSSSELIQEILRGEER